MEERISGKETTGRGQNGCKEGVLRIKRSEGKVAEGRHGSHKGELSGGKM
jgi:hypothetical protein